MARELVLHISHHQWAMRVHCARLLCGIMAAVDAHAHAAIDRRLVSALRTTSARHRRLPRRLKPLAAMVHGAAAAAIWGASRRRQ